MEKLLIQKDLFISTNATISLSVSIKKTTHYLSSVGREKGNNDGRNIEKERFNGFFVCFILEKTILYH